jgi:hypothetical protein
VAIIAVYTLWSQVGGQYHLDLMFWPWKLGLGVGAAALVVALSCDPKRAVLYGSLLILLAVAAGVVTYYYHLNEPSDEDEGDQPAKVTKTLTRRDMRFLREP